MYRRNEGSYLHELTTAAAAAAAAIPTKCIKLPTDRPTDPIDYTYEIYKPLFYKTNQPLG